MAVRVQLAMVYQHVRYYFRMAVSALFRLDSAVITRAAMNMLQGHKHDPLITALSEKENQVGAAYWSFNKPTVRTGAHALLHYPAMMVPSLQAMIMDCVSQGQQESISVLDPFVGSGTVLVEAMEHGLDFFGLDINPLAGLACLVKAGPYYVNSFDEKMRALARAINADKRTHTARQFNGRDKWFSMDVSKELEKIHFHIRREPSQWARRLFWLALCRVVRVTCRSRKSTYKLHIEPTKSQPEIANVYAEFTDVLGRFSTHLREQHNSLIQKNLLARGRYIGKLGIEVADTQSYLSQGSISQYDLVMTSPPYGDNATTIPYGQFSYLPLQWIDLEDIGIQSCSELVANTHATDTASLGGRLRGAKKKVESLADRYEAAKDFIGRLESQPNGQKRFGAFFYDLDRTVAGIASATRTGGVHSWTVSNRRICGLEAPMVPLLTEMLEARDIRVIGTISRGIHFKKMAAKNSLSATMTTETILLARKLGPT